jgi:hypothetical protein
MLNMQMVRWWMAVWPLKSGIRLGKSSEDFGREDWH